MRIIGLNFRFYLIKKYGIYFAISIFGFAFSSITKGRGSSVDLIEIMHLPNYYYLILGIICVVSFISIIYLIFSPQRIYSISVDDFSIELNSKKYFFKNFDSYFIDGLYHENYKDLIIFKVILKNNKLKNKFYSPMSLGEKKRLERIFLKNNLKQLNPVD